VVRKCQIIILCESGGIGRRAGFRFLWASPVRVRVSPFAPFYPKEIQEVVTMQVSVESPSNLGRKLTISIPSDKIESAVSIRVQDLTKKVKVDGFRPGKVPAKVVEQKYGAGIREEVTHDLLQSSLFEAIKEQDLKPAGQPFVEPGDMKPGQNFEFTATFDVFPEITVKEIDGSDVEQYQSAVAQSDVDNTVKKLQEQHLVWNDVERAAASGDKVVIDFDGYKNGEPFDGGKSENFDLELGSASMIPGFESQIEGMNPSEEKDLEITFPEDYGHKDLAGQDVVFKIKLHTVRESALPDVNAEFVQQFDIEDGSVEAFLADVKKNMERELSKALVNMNKDKAFEAFLKVNTCDVPKALIENEIKGLKEDMIKRVFGNQKVDPSKVPNLPDDMFIEQANKRVQLGLVFSEYVQVHDLKADPKRVDETLQSLAQSYDKPEELLDWYRGSKERMEQIESSVLEELAVEKILESAKQVFIKKDYDSVMNPKPESQETEDTAEDDKA
jgi:trigger factor